MTEENDIDLLIVERCPGNRHEECVAILDGIRDIAFAGEIKVIALDWFEATKNIVGGIAYPAHKYGRVLYAAA